MGGSAMMNSANHEFNNLPTGLARPALRALNSAGVHQLEALTQFTEREVAGWHGIGPRAMSLLRQAMKDKGLSFSSIKGEAK